MPVTKARVAATKVKAPKAKSIAISETTIRKAAARLLPVGSIVSVEVEYLQRTLTGSISAEQLDASILAVRKLPWSSIAPAD